MAQVPGTENSGDVGVDFDAVIPRGGELLITCRSTGDPAHPDAGYDFGLDSSAPPSASIQDDATFDSINPVLRRGSYKPARPSHIHAECIQNQPDAIALRLFVNHEMVASWLRRGSIAGHGSIVLGLDNLTTDNQAVLARIDNLVVAATHAPTLSPRLPGPPTNVVISKTSRSDQVSVAFVPPTAVGRCPIIRYIVKADAHLAGPNGVGTETAAGSNSPITINVPIGPGFPYDVTVTAVNCVGPGAPSDPAAG